MFCSTIFWFKYGFILGDVAMSVVNGLGMLLALYAVLIYHRHTVHQGTCEYFAIAALGGVLVWLILIANGRIKLDGVGFSAMTASVAMFTAPLVALYHILQHHFSGTSHPAKYLHRSRASIWQPREGLSLGMIAISLAVSGSWLLYGRCIGDAYVSLPNGLGLIMSGLQLCVWSIAYPSSSGSFNNDLQASTSSASSSLAGSQNALLTELKDPFLKPNSVAPFIELKRF